MVACRVAYVVACVHMRVSALLCMCVWLHMCVYGCMCVVAFMVTYVVAYVCAWLHACCWNLLDGDVNAAQVETNRKGRKQQR